MGGAGRRSHRPRPAGRQSWPQPRFGPRGRLGVILPTGIATDATTQYFFCDVVESAALASLYDFENRKPLFEAVDSRFKFCLLTLTGRALREGAADFALFVHHPADLAKPDVPFALKPDEITLLNPNTGTCLVFRSRRDAEITLGIYRRVPVLLRDSDAHGSPWGLSFMQGLFNMTSDSHLFRTWPELQADGYELVGNTYVRGDDVMLPLYEAKMVHHYDHRWATYGDDGTTRDLTLEEKADPDHVVYGRYWVDQAEVQQRLASRWDRKWLLGWRDITNSTNERTRIASVIPVAAVDHKMPLAVVGNKPGVLLASWSALVHDYVTRQKIGGPSLTYFYLKQVPSVPPGAYDGDCPWDRRAVLADWIERRVELSYTAWDMEPFALHLGDEGPPFVWDEERRALLRAELDAAYSHLYGLDRDEVDYVLDTFPIVRRKDEAKYGEYRTKRLILEIYDAMAKEIETGNAYQDGP